jgi:hypothetical protein
VASARQQLAANIRLDVHAAPLPVASNTFNFGDGNTIGSVQAGNDSTAYVTQLINSPEREDFKQALSTLIALIEAAPSQAVKDKGELVELLRDARVEADKPAPNRLKISTALGAAGATVSMIANEPAAFANVAATWEAFKALLGA